VKLGRGACPCVSPSGVLAAPYGPAASFLKEAAKLSWKPIFILEQTAVDPKLVELAGPAAEGALNTALPL